MPFVYGDKRDYPKIDLYVKNLRLGEWLYVGSTTWARGCREAKKKYVETHPETSIKLVRAEFDERRK